jgi:hypothetical protein
MSDKSSEPKKYDHASSLSRQIERLNDHIIKGMGNTESNDYSNYLDSIIMGLMTVENFYLHPFTDQDYEEFSKTKILAMSNKDKIEFINQAQNQIAEQLKQSELFFKHFTEDQIGNMDKNNETD